jgi:predicted nucleic acid-binding protein
MFLLDTSVLSESSKRRLDPIVAQWLAGQAPGSVFLSVLTVGEVQQGVSKRDDGPERDRLALWMEAALEEFADQILGLDLKPHCCGENDRLRSASRRPVPVVDALIAATALRHKLTVVTRNVDDFVACGVPVLNPWEAT